ncbi:hypothetical protein RFI_06444, partial [Reticulomyxa filosa]
MTSGGDKDLVKRLTGGHSNSNSQNKAVGTNIENVADSSPDPTTAEVEAEAVMAAINKITQKKGGQEEAIDDEETQTRMKDEKAQEKKDKTVTVKETTKPQLDPKLYETENENENDNENEREAETPSGRYESDGYNEHPLTLADTTSNTT